MNLSLETETIYIVTNNIVYKELFETLDGLENVVHLSTIEGNISCKAIFLDGNTIPLSMLKNVRQLYPKIPIFYQSIPSQNQLQLNNVITTCAAHQVQSINENHTNAQVVKDIDQYLYHRQSNSKRRIVGFFGTHSGAGTSTTLLNIADLLAENIVGKVLVLSLNPWDASDYFLEYDGQYLNDLKSSLRSKTLSNERFLNSIHHYENSFYHLAGNRDIKMQRAYQNEEIEYLLEIARDLFDVVLIDAGPHFDNACYAQTLKGSDLRFLITTQEPKGYISNFPLVYEQLIEPLGSTKNDFLLLINRFVPHNALATEKDIVERLNMSHITTIPEETHLGSSAIVQKKLLSKNGVTKEYAESLMPIVRAIISQYNLKQVEKIDNDQKNGFFSKIIRRKQIQ